MVLINFREFEWRISLQITIPKKTEKSSTANSDGVFKQELSVEMVWSLHYLESRSEQNVILQ